MQVLHLRIIIGIQGVKPLISLPSNVSADIVLVSEWGVCGMEVVFYPGSASGSELAFKVFEALKIIRSNYLLEIYMRVEGGVETLSCIFDCGPPSIKVGRKRINLEDALRTSVTPEDLAEIIMEAVSAGGEDASEESLSLSTRNDVPRAMGLAAS